MPAFIKGVNLSEKIHFWAQNNQNCQIRWKNRQKMFFFFWIKRDAMFFWRYVKGPFVSLTSTKLSISLSSLWDSWGLSRSVSRRECWLETRSPFQHSRNGQDVAWLQLKLTLANRRNKRNHQIIIVTFSVLAYRKFLRFDYIIKGRKCDWFESIPVLASITGALRAKWGERVIFSLPRSPTLHARFALRAKCRVRLACLMKRSLCRIF